MAQCLYCFEERGNEGVCRRCGYDESSPRQAAGPELSPGTPLVEGKYLVGRVLGIGGFGVTYLGYDTRLKVKVAIKEFFPRHLVGRAPGTVECRPHDEKTAQEFADGLRRFVREAQTVARFDAHPHVVAVKDFFEENGTAYIVMSYIEGQSLADYLERQPGKKVSFGKALEIFLPILDALEKIHRARLLHRDVSPENIYLSGDGTVKLIDFGAARQVMVRGESSATVSVQEGYAPVEQYSKHGRQGPWTDIYAAAATLYRTLTGVMPPASLERVHHDTLLPPSKQGSDLPPRAERALLKALSLRPEDRYQQVSVFRRDLLAASRPRVWDILAADWRVPVLIVVVIVAVVLGAKMYFDSNRHEEIPPEAMRFIGKDPAGNPLEPSPVERSKKRIAASSPEKKKKKKKETSAREGTTQKSTAVVAVAEEEEGDEEEEEPETRSSSSLTEPMPAGWRDRRGSGEVQFVKTNMPRGAPEDLFRRGLGLERAGNRRKAIEYYEAACEQNYAVACYQEAKLAGDKQLYAVSRSLFSKECAEGKAYACTNYGTMLAKGEGGSKDAVKARDVLDRACEKKQTVACLLLAELWEKGEGGVIPDEIMAARYYKRVCELNMKEGCRRYADLLASGKAGEADGEKAAKYYYWRACSLGDKVACQKQAPRNGKKEKKK